MNDDPTIQWQQATRFGIEVDPAIDAWHSGHVTDVLELADTPDAVVLSTDSGGAWVIVGDSNPLQLSDNWENPDVKCLAVGPDGARHLFAGCTYAYSGDHSGSAPVLMETDLATLAPLLNWVPVAAPLPATAGRVMRIVVVPNLRRIVVACGKVQAGDTGGLFWAQIPPSRFSPSDPPRTPYIWREALVTGVPSKRGFWDVAVGARAGRTPRESLEDHRDITLVAGGFQGGGVYFGQWDDADELVLRRSTVAFDNGADATSVFFKNGGTTSISSCAEIPSVVYAAAAWPDGRLNAVLRSKDGGRHWVFCAARMASATGPLDLLVARTGDQGSTWNNRVAAHPGNPGMAALGWQAGTFLTLDAGKEWRFIDGGSHFHADVHALMFQKDVPDSIGNLYIGSDGGLARVNLDDFLGLTGQPFRSTYNRSLPTLQCYSNLIRQFYGSMDASSQKTGLIATGLQDNGNVFCTLEPSLEPWRHADHGDGGWNAFLSDGAYAHNTMGEPVVVTAPPDTAGNVSTEVAPITLPPPGDPSGLRGPVAEAVMLPRFRNRQDLLMTAVASSAQSVYGLFSAAAGAVPRYRWERLGAIPGGEVVTALASFQGDRVIVGTSGGKLYSIDAATGTVLQQAVNLPKPSPSTRMEGGTVTRIVGFSDSEMFAVLIGAAEVSVSPPGPPGIAIPLVPLIQTYVLRLNGVSWSNTAGNGLPNEYIYGIVAVAAPRTRVERGLLAGTDGDVYITRDDAATWQRASTGLPRHPHCADLRFAPRESGGGTLYLSTYGRSVWSASLG